VEVLSGPVLVLTALLALAGAFKLRRPAPTAGALRAMSLPSGLLAVRALGAFELVVGTASMLSANRALLALSAACYLAFAAFVAAALVSGAPVQSCGCFGQPDTPPSRIHLAFDAVAAAVLIAATAGEVPPPASVLADQPWAGVPFVVLTATALLLSYLVLTALAAVLSPTHRPRAA